MAKKPSVNIVIPVYNEEMELAGSVKTLTDYLTNNLPTYGVRWVKSSKNLAFTSSSILESNLLGYSTFIALPFSKLPIFFLHKNCAKALDLIIFSSSMNFWEVGIMMGSISLPL